ncbi:MAG: hypothetical protein J3R72DRAFT_434153 [Linnemannia gamsii]|nr:MAG: hypothetical protein J3R72DRAFT_434153 [Linnemannia gamsii]
MVRFESHLLLCLVVVDICSYVGHWCSVCMSEQSMFSQSLCRLLHLFTLTLSIHFFFYYPFFLFDIRRV